MTYFRTFRSLFAVFCLAFIAACSANPNLDGPVDPIGEFRLGYNIVVADGAREVEPSRDATPDEWKKVMEKAMNDRFSRYDGSQLYHLAVAVQAYSIAVPGIPLVVAPKSVLVVTATVWDDAAGGKINAEPEDFTVIETFTGENMLVGSGLGSSKEEQMENLANNAARQIENWMRDNPDWFAAREGAASSVKIVNNKVIKQ